MALTRASLMMLLTSGVKFFDRQTFGATVVNLTIALSAKLYDKIYFDSSNMMFVICRKFEL